MRDETVAKNIDKRKKRNEIEVEAIVFWNKPQRKKRKNVNFVVIFSVFCGFNKKVMMSW